MNKITTIFGIHIRQQTLNTISLIVGILSLVMAGVNIWLLSYTSRPKIFGVGLIILLFVAGIINLAFYWANRE